MNDFNYVANFTGDFMKFLFIKKIIPLLLLSSIYTYGQGIIKGTVRDSLTTSPLKGAEIILTGTNFSTVSDIDGEFYISGIPVGEYILQSFFLGYNKKKMLVAVKTKGPQILNIKLLPNNLSGGETALSSQAKSQAEVINMQISSNNIKNVIAGNKLQNMPDENITEALRGLPGISILHKTISIPSDIKRSGSFSFKNEDVGPLFLEDDFFYEDGPVSKIFIRGLDSKYSDITIDGIRISPTSAKDKSIDMSIFSDGDLQNIELCKTITSDEDADATAGAINIITAKAPSKRIIKAELSGNYNRFDKSADQYNFSGSYSERFLDDLIGIHADAGVQRNILSNEYQNFNYTISAGNILEYTNAKRDRYGANIFLDFVTPDGGSIKFNNIYNKIYTDYFESKADSSIYREPFLIFNDREEEQNVFLSSIEGSNYLFGLNVDWNAGISGSKSDYPFNYKLNFWGLSDFTKYYLENVVDNPSENYNREKTVSININKKYFLSDEITGEFKLGGKYRITSRSYYEDLRAETGNLSGNSQYRKIADGSLVKKDFSGTRFEGLVGESKSGILLSYFLDDPHRVRTLFDKYTIPLLSKDALHLWRQLTFSEYYSNDGADINSYDFSQRVLAGYVMHTFNFRQRVKFITGFRIESEHNNYSGYYFPEIKTTVANLYNDLPQKTNKYHYNQISILPNFQMILKPSDFLKLRLAVYKTLIRPDISARIPKFFSVSFWGDFLNMGNPDLKNSDVLNYEFQTQFYGKTIGLLSINAFYKDIEGMQQATNGFLISGKKDIEALGISWSSLPSNFPFGNNSFNLYTYFNSPKPTRIWGFEIEHQANSWFLPGFLKNIILNYNFTFLNSETWALDIKRIYSATTQYLLLNNKQRLSDMSNFLANVTLGYDIKGLSFKISYFYQNGYLILDDYNRIDFTRLQLMKNKLSNLDILVRQQILKNIFFYLNLNNITNSKEETLYKIFNLQTWRTAQAYRYGMNVNFGIVIDL